MPITGWQLLHRSQLQFPLMPIRINRKYYLFGFWVTVRQRTLQVLNIWVRVHRKTRNSFPPWIPAFSVGCSQRWAYLNPGGHITCFSWRVRVGGCDMSRGLTTTCILGLPHLLLWGNLQSPPRQRAWESLLDVSNTRLGALVTSSDTWAGPSIARQLTANG